MNPKIDFLLLPTTRPYPFLHLTYSPLPLYWLGTSGWCLSLVHAPLSCESITYLLFMHLPLPACLFGLCCTFCYSFLTLCGVDESLGLHYLHLVSSLVWVLLRCEPFLIQFSPCLFLLLVCRLASIPAMPLHCFCHVII